MASLWTIRLLGGLDARCGEQLIERFESRPTAALLSLLAFHLGEAQPRELLIEALWPGVQPAAGRHRLSQALSSLRRQLEPVGVAAGTVFAADRFTVTLRADAVSTDLQAFEAAAEDPAQLDVALRLYRGPLLPGFYEDWIVDQQVRLEDRYCHLVLDRLRQAADAGDLGLAIDLARRGLAVHPLREDLHAALLGLFVRAGEPAAAERHAAGLAALWKSELQAPLSPALERLIASLPHGAGAPAPPIEPARRETPAELTGTVAMIAIATPSPESLLSMAGEPTLREHQGGLSLAHGRVSAALRWAAEQLDVDGALRLAVLVGELDPVEPGIEHALRSRAVALARAARPGQVLADEPAAALAAAAGVASRELGRFRVSASEPPRRLFALGIGDRPIVATPPEAERAVTGAVPQPPDRFFGREAELAAVCGLLRGGARLLTLLGPGGTGKTRLAIEAGLRLDDLFVGGVWFVDLSAATDATTIPATILSRFRVPRAPGTGALEQTAEVLARRPCLLVLDNLEQLIDGAARLIADLLRLAPGWACLATSRRPLDIAAEQRYPLAPLPLPAAGARLEQLADEVSVRLFCDRARKVRPSFELTAHNAVAVAGICRHLEGIPLALELAAARVQKLAPGTLLQRLADRFGTLVTRRRDAVDRQRTLRAAIDWSFELLEPAEQSLLTDLAVFHGVFDSAAVEAVSGLAGARTVLDSLVESSLLLPAESAAGEAYRLLETVREYAAERLDVSRRDALSAAHLAHYLALAEAGADALHGPEQGAWGLRLEAAEANLTAAIEHGLVRSDLLESSLRLASAMAWPWYTTGQWHEARPLVARALAMGGGSSQARAGAYHTAALLAWGAGDYAAAAGMVELGLGCLRELPDPARQAAALRNLAGLLAWRRGDCAGAIVLFQQAEELASQAGDLTIWAATRHNQGLVHYELDDHAAAGDCYRVALERRERQGDLRGQAISLTGLGEVALEHRDPAAANALLLRALALYRQLEQPWGVANVLSDLAMVAIRQRRYPEARAWLGEATEIMGRIGHGWGLADAAADRGQIAYECGEFDVAVAEFSDAARQFLTIGDQPCVAGAIEGLGMALVRVGRYEDAATALACAEAIRHRIDAPRRKQHTRDLERYVDLLRQALDPGRFAALWEAGGAATVVQVLDDVTTAV